MQPWNVIASRPAKQDAGWRVVASREAQQANQQEQNAADRGDTPLANSGQDVIRGSSNIPLSEKGLQQSKELGEQFARKGGVDLIVASDLTRAQQTGQAIASACEAPMAVTPALHPWHLGEIEGQPTKEVLDRINEYIVKHPDEDVPGRGPQSIHDGESFNDFKSRLLPYVMQMMAVAQRNPNLLLLLVTHYRDLRLLEAWVDRGTKPTMEINEQAMTQTGATPGEVYHFSPSQRGRWTLKHVDMEKDDPLPGGLYIVRHAVTEWNAENSEQDQERATSRTGDSGGGPQETSGPSQSSGPAGAEPKV